VHTDLGRRASDVGSTESILELGYWLSGTDVYNNVWLPIWDVIAGTHNALFPFLPPLWTTNS
jgi:hypothetical protein